MSHEELTIEKQLMINHQDLLSQSGTLNSVQRSRVLATNLTASLAVNLAFSLAVS